MMERRKLAFKMLHKEILWTESSFVEITFHYKKITPSIEIL